MTSPSSSNDPDMVPAASAGPSPGPWGLGATVLWTVLFAAAMLVAGIMAAIVFQARGHTALELPANGDYVSLTLGIQTVLFAAVVFLALVLRSPYAFREYLAVRPASIRSFAFWAAVLFVYNVASEYFMSAIDAGTSPWMEDIYGSARHLGLLWAAVVLLAPLCEETVFRGFIFKGVEARLGPAAAVLSTAVLWSALHLMQYNQWYYMVIVGGLAVMFGVARYTSGAILVPLVLHVLNNLGASIQMQWFN